MVEELGPGGRDAAFTAWVRQHRPLLTRSAFLLCGDAHAAEDLVQTCLTRVYLAWPRVAAMDAPVGYARRALVNAHIDQTRRPWWSRERAPATDTGLSGQLAAGVTTDPAAAVVERDTLMAALRQLPPGQRRVVVLRHLWELPVRDTALELGCSEGTVKSQDHAALQRLRELLEPRPIAEGTTRGVSRDGRA